MKLKDLPISDFCRFSQKFWDIIDGQSYEMPFLNDRGVVAITDLFQEFDLKNQSYLKEVRRFIAENLENLIKIFTNQDFILNLEE